MKKLMKMIIIIIIMNKSQELTIFHGRQNLHKEPPEVGLVKKLTGS